MRANDALLLRLREYVHRPLEALRPIPFGQTMHETNVNVVRPQLLTETVEVRPGSRRIARPGLGQHRNLIAWDMPQRLGHMRMASIGVGRVKEPQALVIPIQKKVRKSLHAQRRLMRMMP